MTLKEVSSLKDGLNKNNIEKNLEEAKVHTHALDGCDCIRMDEEVASLIDSDAHWPMEDNACGPLQESDVVEDAIQWWIGYLNDAGYYEEDSQRAVFDALAALVEHNIIPDCPDIDQPLPIKNSWVARFNERIQVKLVELGIDLQG
jgi:hypothetical protein